MSSQSNLRWLLASNKLYLKIPWICKRNGIHMWTQTLDEIEQMKGINVCVNMHKYI